MDFEYFLTIYKSTISSIWKAPSKFFNSFLSLYLHPNKF
jgi:hypothetical protein